MEPWMIIGLIAVGVLALIKIVHLDIARDKGDDRLSTHDERLSKLERSVAGDHTKSSVNINILKDAIMDFRASMVRVIWTITPLANGKFHVVVVKPVTADIQLVGGYGRSLSHDWYDDDVKENGVEVVNRHVSTLGDAQRLVLDTLTTIGSEGVIGSKDGNAILGGKIWV